MEHSNHCALDYVSGIILETGLVGGGCRPSQAGLDMNTIDYMTLVSGLFYVVRNRYFHHS